MTNLDSTLKSRHYFANKGPSSQSYGFSSSHVWIWELDYKESCCCCCCCKVASVVSDPMQPIDGSPPDSPVPGILKARTLEWVAISFSSAWNWKVKVKSLSRVRLLATPWAAAYQAPPSMGFSRQEYWSGVSLPSPIKKAEPWRIDAFELWCWRRLLRVPLTARRSNQSILKEIISEYSLEGPMLKLKFQYFGYLIQRTDSLEKTLIWG